ncbi:MAG: ABC transporter [Symploca sp. SIO2E9]|nr:ABC transporter [Symploca sp. SIO2E9]
MQTIKSQKYWKHLFWLGPILSIMGVTAGVVSGKWLPVPLGLLIAGIVVIGLWLLFLGTLTPEFWGRRSTQTGANAIIATLSILVILGLINFLGVRYGQRIDLTENQLLTLSPLSQKVVQNLQQSVKVWIFDPIPNPDDRELLENYRRYGSKLEFEFVDPEQQPTIAQKFKVQDLGEVYLEYGADRQFLQRISEQEPLLEAKLTNGIARLTSDRYDKVYFLQGHGELPLEQVEGGLSQAVSILEERNFTALPLNLAQNSEVPEDASLVVVAGPKRALFEQEVKVLSEYLSKNGSLLLMLDPDTNPGFDSLLAEWGVELDSRLAIDASSLRSTSNLGPATPLVTNYGNHPITKDFAGGLSFYPLARPLDTKSVEGIEETALLITSEDTWAESNPEEQPLEFNSQQDRPGPLMLGVALSRKAKSSSTSSNSETEALKTPEASPTPSAQEQAKASPKPKNKPKADENKSESRLVVFGDSNFAINGWFGQQLNGDIFLNSISWLSKQDDQILSIRPKQQQNRRINLTTEQKLTLSWSALLMPLLGFMTAGVIWWLRR